MLDTVLLDSACALLLVPLQCKRLLLQRSSFEVDQATNPPPNTAAMGGYEPRAAPQRGALPADCSGHFPRVISLPPFGNSKQQSPLHRHHGLF